MVIVIHMFWIKLAHISFLFVGAHASTVIWREWNDASQCSASHHILSPLLSRNGEAVEIILW